MFCIASFLNFDVLQYWEFSFFQRSWRMDESFLTKERVGENYLLIFGHGLAASGPRGFPPPGGVRERSTGIVMSLLFCATADSPAQVDSRSHGPHMGSDRSRCGNSPGKGGISVLHFFVKKDSPPLASKDKKSRPTLGSSSLVVICDQVSTLTKWLCRKSIAAGVSLMHRAVRYSFPAAII